MIDLRPELLAMVSTILKEQVPDYEVRAFGSRVSWTAKEHSDLDLVVRGKRRLTLKKLAAIKEAFEESELPIRVDVLDWHGISESFRKVIERNCEVIQRGKGGEGGMAVLHKPSTATQLPSNWSWKRLDEVCEGIFDCPHSTPVLSGKGPFLARSQDMRSGVFRTDKAAHVSQEIYNDRIVRAEPRHGDLLYSREGTYFGIAAEVPANIRVCLGQRMVLIRPNPSIVSFRFLRFWLNSPVMAHHMEGQRDGSVAERLNLPTIRALPIAVPPLPEQRAIAHILGTLDDKIELNRRMNETLEAMARALFKSWFADFDPVRAKAEGRDTGLPEHIAGLFPDRFVDSELGEIPEGWEVGTLAGYSSLNPELWSKQTRPPTIRYVDLSNTKWGRIDEVTEYHREKAPSRAQRVLRPGDTIIGTVRPGNGSYTFVSENGLTGSTGFAVLRPTQAELSEFVYLAATQRENIEALSHLADGGAYPAIRPDVVTATTIVLAPAEVVKHFSKCAGTLFARLAQNEREIRTLSALRSNLLPKLISGELRLGNTGRIPREVPL
jgi:type I restriction enzyme S subunit